MALTTADHCDNDVDAAYLCEAAPRFNVSSTTFVVNTAFGTGVGHAMNGPEDALLCAFALGHRLAYVPISSANWAKRRTHNLTDFFERYLGLDTDPTVPSAAAALPANASLLPSKNCTIDDDAQRRVAARKVRAYLRARYAAVHGGHEHEQGEQRAPWPRPTTVRIAMHVRRGDTLHNNPYQRNMDISIIPDDLYLKAAGELVRALRVATPTPLVIAVDVVTDGCGTACNYNRSTYVDEWARETRFEVPEADATSVHVGDDSRPDESFALLMAADVLLMSCSGFSRRIGLFYARGLVVGFEECTLSQPLNRQYIADVLGTRVHAVEAVEQPASLDAVKPTHPQRVSVMALALLDMHRHVNRTHVNLAILHDPSSRDELARRLADRLRGIQVRLLPEHEASFRKSWLRYWNCGHLCPPRIEPLLPVSAV